MFVLASLQRSNRLESFNFSGLQACTTKNCDGLLEAIGKAVDKKLYSVCQIESICHEHEIKAEITEISSVVSLEQKEQAGSLLKYRKEPKELKAFSYLKLKESAKEEVGLYRGILHGTVSLNQCPIKADCPECGGKGYCSRCDGTKQITCTVCEGSNECVSCGGTGKYTCRNCDGDGECPECNDGWVTCGECNGDGTVSCPDCWGSGNYIDEPCRECGGSGYYGGYKTCRVCGGTGRFVKKCNRCKGRGTIRCNNCDGEGGWECEDCHGTGECSHCHGKGYLPCKSCGATGVCGKCKGRGQIWCPDCQGKGICFNCAGTKEVTCPRCEGLGQYQSYTEYVLKKEKNKTELFCSLPINSEDFTVVSGTICYDGEAFESFAKTIIIDNSKPISDSLSTKKHAALINKWLSKEHFSDKEKLSDNYFRQTIKVHDIPITKVVLVCNTDHYPIYIVGNNLMVFYESLPSWTKRLGARIKSFFKK